jgi:hypothetical protein
VSVAGKHRRACAFAGVVALLGAGASGRAFAGTTDISTQLDYAAAPGCPPVEAFESVVRGGLGYDPFRADAPIRVLVRIDTVGHTIQGRVEWRSVDGRSIGEQTFPSRSGDCAELTRAIGFALTLQIQLMATTAAGGDAEPPPAARTEPPPAVERPRPPAAAPSTTAQIASTPIPPAEPPTSIRPAILLGVGGSAGFGLASNPVALTRLFASAAWSRLALELGAEIGLPSTTSRPDGAGFSQEELLVSLAACGLYARWSGCALAKIGELRIAGEGVDVPLTASGVMAHAGVRLAASQGLGARTYIVARAEGLTRLTQGTVTLDSMPVWAIPRFAAAFGIDIGLKLP